MTPDASLNLLPPVAMPPRSMRHSVRVLSRPSRTPTALGCQPLSVVVSRETALSPRCWTLRAALPANSHRAAGQASPLDRKAIALLTESPVPQQVSQAFHVKRPHRPRPQPCALRSWPTSLRSRTYWLGQRGDISPRYQRLAPSYIHPAVSRETSARDSSISAPTGSTPEAAPADDAPAHAYRAARTLGVPHSGYLVALAPHEADQGRHGAVNATQTPLVNASRVAEPASPPPAVARTR